MEPEVIASSDSRRHKWKHRLILVVGALAAAALMEGTFESFRAIFVPALKLSPDYCLDEVVEEGEMGPADQHFELTTCVEFKNGFEECKYDHNMEVDTRINWLFWISLALGSFVYGKFYLWFARRTGNTEILKTHAEVPAETWGGAMFSVLFAGLALHLLLGDQFRSGVVRMLPNAVIEIRDAQMRDAVDRCQRGG